MTEHVLSTLDNSRKYTLAVADAMPESGYNTRPSEEVWDFRELLHHIAYGIQWWEDNYIHGKTVSRIGMQLKNVNVFREEDWPVIISFLKPRMIALDFFLEPGKRYF